MTPDVVISHLNRGHTYNESNPIVLIGHSHGGWLMMKIAAALSRETAVLLLATLDPISRELCFGPRYVDALRSVLRRSRPDFEAEDFARAPADLRSAGPVIAQNVHRFGGTWINYYQKQFMLLHSSPIADADANRLRRYNNGETVWDNAHLKVLMDAFVWNEIQRVVVRQVQQRAAAR